MDVHDPGSVIEFTGEIPDRENVSFSTFYGLPVMGRGSGKVEHVFLLPECVPGSQSGLTDCTSQASPRAHVLLRRFIFAIYPLPSVAAYGYVSKVVIDSTTYNGTPPMQSPQTVPSAKYPISAP